MIFKKIVLTFFVFTNLAFSQDSLKFNITVIGASFDVNDSLFIAGSRSEIGSWNPSKVKFTRTNDSLFTREFKFPKGTSLEYKFTKGSWDREAVDANGAVPQNYTIKLNRDTSIIYRIDYWKDQFESQPRIVNGQITGKVRYHEGLKYKFLPQRDLIVWLPPNYETSNEYYPVLYMHDGQNIFDPKTSSIGTDWQIDETADSLIHKNIITPMIIVGIYNSNRRMSEYTPSDTGYVYVDFVVNKVKPLIDSLYRTKHEREFTYTGGSSAGGLISFVLLWERSDIFSKAICMSPAFKISTIDYVTPVINYKGERKDIMIYIDNGGIGLEDQLQHGIDEMLEPLNLQGYIEGKDYLWIKDTEAVHNEAAWAERIPNAFKWLFAK